MLKSIKGLKKDLKKLFGNKFMVAVMLDAKVSGEMYLKMLYDSHYWMHCYSKNPKALAGHIECDKTYKIMVYPNVDDHLNDNLVIERPVNVQEELEDKTLVFGCWDMIESSELVKKDDCPLHNKINAHFVLPTEVIDKMLLSRQEFKDLKAKIDEYIANQPQ